MTFDADDCRGRMDFEKVVLERDFVLEDRRALDASEVLRSVTHEADLVLTLLLADAAGQLLDGVGRIGSRGSAADEGRDAMGRPDVPVEVTFLHERSFASRTRVRLDRLRRFVVVLRRRCR